MNLTDSRQIPSSPIRDISAAEIAVWHNKIADLAGRTSMLTQHWAHYQPLTGGAGWNRITPRLQAYLSKRIPELVADPDFTYPLLAWAYEETNRSFDEHSMLRMLAARAGEAAVADFIRVHYGSRKPAKMSRPAKSGGALE